MSILDLRPAKGSIIYELVRLGFQFDHSGDGSSQSWANYQIQARADFAGPDATEVIFGDLATRLSTTVNVSDLADVDHVSTWTGDNPVTPAETPAEATGEPTA